MGRYILAWDLGTGGNKASLYDVDGNCLAAIFVPYETRYPAQGFSPSSAMTQMDDLGATFRRSLSLVRKWDTASNSFQP